MSEFPKVIEGYTLGQIFNCDETGLNFRKMPGKTLISSFERGAEGRKESKDRVTINACANVTGSIKLPLLLIGKSKRPRCFRNINMSNINLTYMSQRNAWVDFQLFLDWFQNVFVPHVQSQLRALKMEPKAILLLDNCPAHPDASMLVSPDKKVTALFLLPNVTSPIQPMDQGILEMLKCRYRKSLVRDLLFSEEEDVSKYLKQVNMLTVVEKVGSAGDGIPAISIRRSCKKLIPMEEESDSLPDESNDTEDTSDFAEELTTLGHAITPAEAEAWEKEDGPGYEQLDEDSILELVQGQGESATQYESDKDEDDVSDEEETSKDCPVSHREALDAFQKCITWLRHQPESSACNLATLSSLRDIAASKRISGLKQTKISSFFS